MFVALLITEVCFIQLERARGEDEFLRLNVVSLLIGLEGILRFILLCPIRDGIMRTEN